MAKQYKIKRYRQYAGGNSFRAKPRPITVVLGVVAVAALVVLGIIVYQPLIDFLGQDHNVSELELPEPVSDLDEASATEASEPEPGPLAVAVGNLRAVYMPPATAQDQAARAAFVEGLAGGDVNAVMVDIKDAAGIVLFRSESEQAAQWNAVAENAFDLSALAGELQAAGLSLVARMWAFQDPLAASANRDIAISYRDTTWHWLDNTAENGGKPWLNPYAQGARNYLTALAVEAAEAGASMVVLASVQCPAGSATNANFGAEAANISRTEILSTFMDDLSVRLEPTGATAAHYVTALSLAQEYENTLRYGGSPLLISADTVVLDALPYQFGAGYNAGGLTVTEPVQNPGDAVQAVLVYAQEQLSANATDAPVLIPLLQGGNEAVNEAAPYTRAQVEAQIGAVSDHSLESYILYSSTGQYLLTP